MVEKSVIGTPPVAVSIAQSRRTWNKNREGNYEEYDEGCRKQFGYRVGEAGKGDEEMEDFIKGLLYVIGVGSGIVLGKLIIAALG